MDAFHYEAIVIGSGPGGNPLRIARAKAGMRTAALIERKRMGETGPTTLISSAAKPITPA
jgi:pyruvate/2-oxoglutarate dehydrogenase complex dihydrolipoamide dehydrogenase (E3) component